LTIILVFDLGHGDEGLIVCFMFRAGEKTGWKGRVFRESLKWKVSVLISVSSPCRSGPKFSFSFSLRQGVRI
jgi:hypothetical protein